MNKNDLYYTAGLLDGEGTITLLRHTSRNFRSPSVQIASTTPELVDYLKTTFGGMIVKSKPQQVQYKPCATWRLTYNAALAFIEQIEPYLKEPTKKRRAELIIRDYKRLTPSNGKYTPEMLVERKAFEDEFFR